MKMLLEVILCTVIVGVLLMMVIETHDNNVKLRLCEMGVEI